MLRSVDTEQNVKVQGYLGTQCDGMRDLILQMVLDTY
jgi:hypothetical protein